MGECSPNVLVWREESERDVNAIEFLRTIVRLTEAQRESIRADINRRLAADCGRGEQPPPGPRETGA